MGIAFRTGAFALLGNGTGIGVMRDVCKSSKHTALGF